VWAYGTGAGVLGALAIGLLAGVTTVVAGQILFGAIRSTVLRLGLALAFATPAAIAGYHAILGISAIGVPSETWRQVFAVIGASIVGFTAAARLTLFTDVSTKPHPTPGGGETPPPARAGEPLRLPAPNAAVTLADR